MNCELCSGEVYIVLDTYYINSKMLGWVGVPGVKYSKCQSCNDVLISIDEAGKVASFVKDREKEAIGNLPISDFLTLNEVAQILGVSKQAISKNSRIARGFIYFVTINGKKLYYEKSVEAFNAKGDGRIPLNSGETLPESHEWENLPVAICNNILIFPGVSTPSEHANSVNEFENYETSMVQGDG